MSYTNFDLIEVRSIRPNHNAIFAVKAITRDTLLGNFDGKAAVVDLSRMDDLDEKWWRRSVQLKIDGSVLYCLVPIWDPEGIDFLGHSCKPNARVDQQIYVHADRDIAPGEEITADFRTFKLVPRGY